MEVLEPQMAVDIEVIAEKLCERQQDVIFLGDGVPVFKDKLCNGLMLSLIHICTGDLDRICRGQWNSGVEAYYP